jgi:hypothetical protein
MIDANERYYSSSVIYPQVILAIGERMRTWLCEILYPDEAQADAMNRVIIADIGSSEDEAIRKASEYLGANQSYPFTAYNFGEFELNVDRKNTNAAMKMTYSSDIDAMVCAIPVKQEFLAVTFCNNPDDYERVIKILLENSATLTLIDVPITYNGVAYDYPVRLEFAPSKGQYAHGFVEYLRTNGIYDIVHNFNMYFFDIIIDTAGTTPIETMTSTLEDLSPIDISLDLPVDTQTKTISDLPEISSTDPTDEEIDVPVANSVILTFNVTMTEASVESAITLDPYFEHDLIWDDDSKVLIIDPKENLSSGTLYTVTVADSAYAFYIHDVLEANYEFSFTTEA